jgi:hypothetical protein
MFVLGAIEASDDSKCSTPASGFDPLGIQNTPPRPPAFELKMSKQIRSACESHREWIKEEVKLGRNAMSIYQDLTELFSFTHRYNSVKRFVRLLKRNDPDQGHVNDDENDSVNEDDNAEVDVLPTGNGERKTANRLLR